MSAARTLILACVLCICSMRSFALDAALDASQYDHTAWKIRDGFSKTRITAFAQTPDGYLWLGTHSGLLRSDGVRHVPWQPPPGSALPDRRIRALLAGRDGTLWIGTERGVASWHGGALVTYPQLNEKFVTGLVEDREGKIWVGAVSVPGGGWLCSIQRAQAECRGEDGMFEGSSVALYEDSKGVLWVAADRNVWRWAPGPPVRYALPDPLIKSRNGLSEAGTGELLVLTSGGIRRLIDGSAEPFVLPHVATKVEANSLTRDRDGGLWIGTPGGGLIHVHHERADTYTRSDGLSGDWVNNLFEDREGNIWAATMDGIDRFRAAAATTYTQTQGLPGPVYAVLADRDESVWINSMAGLYRWLGGRIVPVIPWRSHLVEAGAGRALFQDRNGRLWIGGAESGFGYLEAGRFVRVAGMPPGIVDAIAEDNHGELWVANRSVGLLRLSSDGRIHRVAWKNASEAGRGLFWRMAGDPVHGGLWVGLSRGIVHLVDGEARASYDLAKVRANARVNQLRVAADGTLWIASDGGVMRLNAGRIAVLDKASGLPCDDIDSTVEDDNGSLWLLAPCGITSIAAADVQAWTAAIDRGQAPQPVRATMHEASEAARFSATPRPYGPNATKARDGKLWFATFDGVAVIDPHRRSVKALPLPVQIERVIADRKAYEPAAHLPLPALVRDLQFDYTAPSLTMPERTVFRYRLDGYDRDWRDAGDRRQAFYTDLKPGDYRFRVIASNNGAAWTNEEAALDFHIAPAYWQTWWFRAFCVAALAALLWLLYWRHVRSLNRQFNMTLEARVGERTRIARELHDTLLQSFHGVLLRFQTAHELLPARPGEAKQLLASSIDQAAEAITEGRDAVQGLRASTTETNDLAPAIRMLGEAIAAENGGDAILRVEVQGPPQSLHPILRDEIFRIAGEALRNAFRHAGAKRIETELRYDERHLRLRVRDDGKGIDPAVLSRGGREGHFGMHGMRERATLIGGTLAVWSAPGSGTEVELSIPASHAYTTPVPETLQERAAS